MFLTSHHSPRHGRFVTALAALLLHAAALAAATAALPTVTTPDPKISEVFQGNWNNTLKPCEIQSTGPSKRPWMVDVGNHYPGWYPAIDALYQTRSYLFCEKNLPLVLTGWQRALRHCQLSNGGVQSTQGNGVGTVFPFKSQDASAIGYPLLTTGTIDLLLYGDSIYRFSQDKTWLQSNIQSMRNAATWLEGWIDGNGMLQSQDYAHDSLMRPGTDGTAQAEAYLAFNKLAALENVLGNTAQRDHDTAVANRLATAARTYLWDATKGYFMEYAVPNDVASSKRLGSVGGVSSTYHNSSDYAGSKAIDGVLGYGSDFLRTGAGAGASEWVANGQTTGAWIQVNLSTPTAVNSVTLYNRTSATSPLSEAFATGTLAFSDGTTVPVTFRPGQGSNAVVSFSSRTVSWVKFTGNTMQAAGGGSAGLAEFEVHPTAQPYLTATHGMTDTNFALVGSGVATDAQAASVWRYFLAHEDSFYSHNGMHAPTFTAELPATYTGAERNAINPYKDTTALGRTWSIDVMMRKRMGDGAGIYKTVGYANALYGDPTSGGGRGFFGERYDLGLFTPGADGQDSTPKYAEYAAEYNSTVVGETLMGITADVDGKIIINPTVPAGWYKTGFGMQNPGVLKDRDIGFLCTADGTTGWVSGKAGRQALMVRLPPNRSAAGVLENGQQIPHTEAGGFTISTLDIADGVVANFAVQAVR